MSTATTHAFLRGRRSLPMLLAAHLCASVVASVLQAEDTAPEKTPTIVRLQVFANEAKAGNKASDPAAQCLGFVVEKSGMILTSYRPLVDPQTGALLPTIKARRVEKKEKPVSATVVALEPTLNFAILKIDPPKSLKASKICPREDIVVGLPVHALSGGEHDALRYSHGEVTHLNSMECYQESMTATMLQASLTIPDNALGGPVFNDKGEVIALHTGYTPSADEEAHDENAADGNMHILPIFLVFNIYESVKLKGNMKSPWTGFSVRILDDSEQAIFPHGRFLGGVGVDYVWEGGPAANAGVRKGDLLVGFSYYPTKAVAAFQKWLYMYGVGFKVKLHFIRDLKEYYAIDYTIEERPDWAKPR